MENIISQFRGFKRQIDELMTRIDIAGKVTLIADLDYTTIYKVTGVDLRGVFGVLRPPSRNISEKPKE